jgi:hypothetical protein
MKKVKNYVLTVSMSVILILNVISITMVYSSTPDIVTVKFVCGGNREECQKGVNCECRGVNGTVVVNYSGCTAYCSGEMVTGGVCSCEKANT